MSSERSDPPWLGAWKNGGQSSQPLRPQDQRTQSGQFPPGVSGNPNGKPVGTKALRTRLIEQFEEGVDDIVAVVKKKAREGDLQAAGLVLSRAVPPKRAVSERTPFELDSSKPPDEQAQQIVAAVAAGELAADDGKVLIDCLASVASLRKFTAFEDELRQMREHLARLTAAAGNSGGQVMFDLKDAAAACARPTLPKPPEPQQ